LANGRQLPEAVRVLTIGELILAFWRHVEQHYRHADGTPTSSLKQPALDIGSVVHACFTRQVLAHKAIEHTNQPSSCNYFVMGSNGQ
jgi:hypothetical protein